MKILNTPPCFLYYADTSSAPAVVWHLTHLHADPVTIQLRLTHRSLPASSLRSIIHLTPVNPFSYLLHFHLSLSPVLSFPSFHFHPSHRIIYLHLRWQQVQPLISAHFVPLPLRLIYILWALQHFTFAPITDIIPYSLPLCLFTLILFPSLTLSPAVFYKDSSGSTQTICASTWYTEQSDIYDLSQKKKL